MRLALELAGFGGDDSTLIALTDLIDEDHSIPGVLLSSLHPRSVKEKRRIGSQLSKPDWE